MKVSKSSTSMDKSDYQTFDCDKIEEKGDNDNNYNASEIDNLLGPLIDPTESDERNDLGNKMWTLNFIGLYAQYAAVGLLYGMSGVALNLCVYVYDGSPNLCANASSIIFLAWSFKIFYGIFTDSFRPYGMRRKPYIIAGWSCTLILLFIMAIVADNIDATTWVALNMLMQAFIMLADVPADGYSVELGQLESPQKRGQILATGQLIRFSFCIVAGAIQTFLLNGPTTNSSDCEIGWSSCWSWGLTVGQYYGLMFGLVLLLFIPILFLKELDGSHIPHRSTQDFFKEIWDTLQNLTTLLLIIYTVGINSFSGLSNKAAVYIQYYLIDLTNFQSGIDTITTYTALVLGIYIFKTYLINVNWRYTSYLSNIFASTMGCLWILVYYNIAGLRNAWFTIFIDLDQSFTQGLSQVLFSMAVIELAKPGQEATTYELLISIANASSNLAAIVSTQLLFAFNGNGCTDDDCDEGDEVDLTSVSSYLESNGPYRYTMYTLCLIVISIAGTIFFTQFLPSDKAQCHTWKNVFTSTAWRYYIGCIGVFLAVTVTLYGIISATLLLDTSTSCLMIVGGSGC